MKNKRSKFVAIIFLIFLLLTGLFLIRVFSGLPNLRLEKELIDNGNASILIPIQWAGFDVREAYEKKTGCESHLIYIASNYGRFPRLGIYEIKDFDSEEDEIQYKKIVDWDISRMKDENNPNYIISIMQTDGYFSGQQINFKIETNHPLLAPTIICRDWVTIQNNHGYIISICDREKRWAPIEAIYPNIISSFLVSK